MNSSIGFDAVVLATNELLFMTSIVLTTGSINSSGIPPA